MTLSPDFHFTCDPGIDVTVHPNDAFSPERI